MSGPCRDCEFRRPGCHGECVHYREYREDYQKRKEHVRSFKQSDAAAVLSDGIQKSLKRRRKKS